MGGEVIISLALFPGRAAIKASYTWQVALMYHLRALAVWFLNVSLFQNDQGLLIRE